MLEPAQIPENAKRMAEIDAIRFTVRTRTPPIRTLVEVPIRFDVKSEGEFLYQQIRGKVGHLLRLGMKQKAIADSLGVHPKTVRKALRNELWENTDSIRMGHMLECLCFRIKYHHDLTLQSFPVFNFL